jgi:hypothetical protein
MKGSGLGFSFSLIAGGGERVQQLALSDYGVEIQ